MYLVGKLKLIPKLYVADENVGFRNKSDFSLRISLLQLRVLSLPFHFPGTPSRTLTRLNRAGGAAHTPSPEALTASLLSVHTKGMDILT